MSLQQEIEEIGAIQQESFEEQVCNFEMLMTESVDEVLTSLGEKCKQAIYFHLQKQYGLNKNEIPTRIKDFKNALEQLFGVGAGIIEIQIMKCFRNRVRTLNPS